MAKKVLLVDDSSIVRRQMGHAIKQAGFELLEASNGRQGIDQIKAAPDISAIITDVNMPEMNGLEMVAEIRKENICNCPIVIVTTEGTQDMIDKGKALGVKGWLVKPVETASLVAVIQKLVGK